MEVVVSISLNLNLKIINFLLNKNLIIIISNTKKVCTFCPCTKTYLIILDNFILSFIIKMFFVLIYNTIHFSFYLKIFLKLKKIKFIDQKNSRVKIKKYCLYTVF